MSAPALPEWAAKLVSLYESHSSNQFILFGNVNDRFVLPLASGPQIGSLDAFLRKVMMPRFNVILTYDLGNGLRVEQGGEIVQKWPGWRENSEMPRAPRAAIEWLTHFFRYAANLARLGRESYQIGFVMKATHLVAPALPGALNYDLNALALLIRDWASDDQLGLHSLVTFLVADNLNDVHPLIVTNPRAATIEIPIPPADELATALGLYASRFGEAFGDFANSHAQLAGELAGTTLGSVENLLRLKHHEKKPIVSTDLVKIKKELVERDAGGLIEFIESTKTLDDVHAQDALKAWLRQDIALWRQSDVDALPMGYLLCGPVGTGKTYMVECLAGEAGVPVVKLKNFRDKWVGSTEGNLEKIFRLLRGLGRCFVFIDEADQALGRRDSGNNDSGLSGRIYSMFAEQMSDSSNRGRIIWILASSRPDLIEVDLKRPGRVDVKIPIFPTTTPEEGWGLLRALARRRGVELPKESGDLHALVPGLLTPGAAEAIAVKLYRGVKTGSGDPVATLREILDGYQSPVPEDVMQFQIAIAAREASDGDFVPAPFRKNRE